MEERKFKIGVMERYFIVVFVTQDESGAKRDGSSVVKTYGGKYLNLETFMDQQKAEYRVRTVVIQNIIELSYEDFKEYVR